MKPLISVIIPVYQHAYELKRALASICGQTYPRLEIIVVDDGSDQAVDISRYRCSRSLVGVRQDHGGAPAARNRGFRQSRGEYIIFWDADVVSEPDMLAKMQAVLQSQSQASYAYSNFYFGKKSMPAQAFSFASLLQLNYITSTTLIRRQCLIPWDEQLKKFQDWDLWLSLAEKGHIGVWIPEYLFRIHPRRYGISHWLPRFAYRYPWRLLPGIRAIVNDYEAAREVIAKKHGLKQAGS